jgi:hypothetical protein
MLSEITAKKDKIEFTFYGLNTRKDEFEKLVFLLMLIKVNNEEATYKSVIHVELYEKGVRCVTTDGACIHVAFFNKRILPGNYHVFIRKDGISLLKPAVNLYFPNWKRLLKHKTIKNGDLDLSKFILKDEEYMNQLCFNATLVIYDNKKNNNFMLFYNDTLLKKEWEVFTVKKRHEIIMYLKEDHNNTISIIMPVINKQREMHL